MHVSVTLDCFLVSGWHRRAARGQQPTHSLSCSSDHCQTTLPVSLLIRRTSLPLAMLMMSSSKKTASAAMEPSSGSRPILGSCCCKDQMEWPVEAENRSMLEAAGPDKTRMSVCAAPHCESVSTAARGPQHQVARRGQQALTVAMQDVFEYRTVFGKEVSPSYGCARVSLGLQLPGSSTEGRLACPPIPPAFGSIAARIFRCVTV